MKKLILSLIAVVGAMTANAQMVSIVKDGAVVKTYMASEVDQVIFSEFYYPEANQKKYVDLGVQVDGKSVFFSNGNINATDQVEEHQFGSYFKNVTTDVANEILGGSWTTNGYEAFKVLVDGRGQVYDWTACEISGVKGMKVSKIGDTDESNYIFLPCCGNMGAGSEQIYNADGENPLAVYRLTVDENPYVLTFNYADGDVKIEKHGDGNDRFWDERGVSIRPVLNVVLDGQND